MFYNRKIKKTPPRLDQLVPKLNDPVFLVSFNTLGRTKILATDEVHSALKTYCGRATDFGVSVGRYVIMPDHIHLFVSFHAGSAVTLGDWVKGLKRCLDQALHASGSGPKRKGQALHSFWQPGFHDHLLRHDESYAAKWDYVRNNPVRAGLVPLAEDWCYQGEIVLIDRV